MGSALPLPREVAGPHLCSGHSGTGPPVPPRSPKSWLRGKRGKRDIYPNTRSHHVSAETLNSFSPYKSQAVAPVWGAQGLLRDDRHSHVTCLFQQMPSRPCSGLGHGPRTLNNAPGKSVLLWVEWCPPPRRCWSPNPRTCECNLPLEKGLCR